MSSSLCRLFFFQQETRLILSVGRTPPEGWITWPLNMCVCVCQSQSRYMFLKLRITVVNWKGQLLNISSSSAQLSLWAVTKNGPFKFCRSCRFVCQSFYLHSCFGTLNELEIGYWLAGRRVIFLEDTEDFTHRLRTSGILLKWFLFPS